MNNITTRQYVGNFLVGLKTAILGLASWGVYLNYEATTQGKPLAYTGLVICASAAVATGIELKKEFNELKKLNESKAMSARVQEGERIEDLLK